MICMHVLGEKGYEQIEKPFTEHLCGALSAALIMQFALFTPS